MGASIPKVDGATFLHRVAARAGVPEYLVTRVYGAFIDELMRSMRCGEDVVFDNFGRFYKQLHKGHQVQFVKPNGREPGRVGDYTVLKFSATKALNRSLGD